MKEDEEQGLFDTLADIKAQLDRIEQALNNAPKRSQGDRRGNASTEKIVGTVQDTDYRDKVVFFSLLTGSNRTVKCVVFTREFTCPVLKFQDLVTVEGHFEKNEYNGKTYSRFVVEDFCNVEHSSKEESKEDEDVPF